MSGNAKSWWTQVALNVGGMAVALVILGGDVPIWRAYVALSVVMIAMTLGAHVSDRRLTAERKIAIAVLHEAAQLMVTMPNRAARNTEDTQPRPEDS